MYYAVAPTMPTGDSYRSFAVNIALILYIAIFPFNLRSNIQTQELELGKPLERDLAGGQSHSYKIRATSGQYLQIRVYQRGIDVVVDLISPDGHKLCEEDSPNGANGPEKVLVIAEATGNYRIDVRSLEKSAETGRYEIKVEELRPAVAADKDRIAARKLVKEAMELENGSPEAKRKGIDRYSQALAVYRRISDRQGEAEMLSSIGWIYFLLGEMQKSLDYYQESLPQRKTIGDRVEISRILTDIGRVYNYLGDRRKALEIFNEALPIEQAVGDRAGQAVTLNNIGIAYLGLGEMQQALDHFNLALPISHAVGDRTGEANQLDNIGLVYYSLGQYQQALDQFNQALAIRRATKDRWGEAATINNIGLGYRALGDMGKALEKYNEVLPIIRAMGDRSAEAITLNNIGKIYVALGERQKALATFNEALPISRAVGSRSSQANLLSNIGLVYLSSGEAQKAMQTYNEALAIRQAIGDRPGEAVALWGLARSEQILGHLTEARLMIEQAVKIIEPLRAELSSQELRASYFASQQGIYQTYIEVLMQMHQQDPANPVGTFAAAALAVSERARARSLIELLTEARADIRQGVDSSLLDRERSLQQRLADRAAAQSRLLNRTHTSAEADAASKEIAAITSELDEVEGRIRMASPRYAAMTQPQPLDLTQIQEQVLDPETLLLEYSLGEEASYLFVVSQTSITSYQLPKRAEIEAATRKVYELLTSPQPRPGESETDHLARIDNARTNYWPQAAALSRILLGPAALQLAWIPTGDN